MLDEILMTVLSLAVTEGMSQLQGMMCLLSHNIIDRTYMLLLIHSACGFDAMQVTRTKKKKTSFKIIF